MDSPSLIERMEARSSFSSRVCKYFLRQSDAALLRLSPTPRRARTRSLAPRRTLRMIFILRLCVCHKGVQGHDHGYAVLLYILNMFLEIDDSLLQEHRGFLLPDRSCAAPPLYFKARTVATSTTASGFRPAMRHFDVKELLGAQIRPEPGFCDR